MSARLILLGEKTREYPLSPRSTLGRHPDATVPVSDRVASKEHAHILQLENGGYRIRDVGSRNGTFVNGVRVDESELQDGDTITLGSTNFRFLLSSRKRRPSRPRTSQRSSRSRQRERRRRPKSISELVEGAPQVSLVSDRIQSQIRSTVDVSSRFLPVQDISDPEILRADYEKLRIAHELSRALAVHRDLDTLLQQIVDESLKLIRADRAVILMYEAESGWTPRCVRRQKDDGEIQLSTSILDEVRRHRKAVLSNDASRDERFRESRSIIAQGIRSTMCVPLVNHDTFIGAFHMDSTFNRGTFTEKDLLIFTGIAGQAAAAIANAKLTKKIEEEAETRARFQRLVSPNLVDQIVSGDIELEQGGQLREVTMLFADIRGFTAMSEKESPQRMVDTLNAYFEEMVQVLFDHGGTLDKYVGDEIIGLFGAPVAMDDAAKQGVACATAMLERLADFNERRQAEGEVPIEIGIGLNTGPVVAGAIGSPQTLQYTVIGDAVNVAARLCSVAKAGEILISQSTYEQCEADFEVEAQKTVRVKGKSNALQIYRVTAAVDPVDKAG